MAYVYLNANDVAAHHVDTRAAVKRQNEKVSKAATENLAATKHTPRIAKAKDPADAYFPARIETEEHDVDFYTILHAPNAFALEFGHAPSGFFDPDKGRGPTKPPAAEYILTRAADGGFIMG